ncbi:unnamed protein product [Closterium sp. Yama58-4]|nr:unnamed protein product [Closterium sp. Yama58-4]
MASPPVLAFDAEGRPVKFDTWLDDLHLFLQLTAKEDISLYDHALGHATAPPTTADSTQRSQWQTRDAHARFAIRNSLPLDEREHFGQHKTAKDLYTAVVARYSSPASAALGRLTLPYLFPDLASFSTVADLITHLRTSEARFRAAMPDEFLATNPPPPLWITLYHIVTRLPDSLRAAPLVATPAPRSLRGVPLPLSSPLSPLLLLSTSLVLRRSGLRLLRAGAAGAKGARVEVAAGEAGVVAVGVAVGLERLVAAVGVVTAAAGAVAGAEAAAEAEVVVAAAGVEVAGAVAAAVVVVEALAVDRVSSPPRRFRPPVSGMHSVALPARTSFALFPDATDLPHWADLEKKGVDIWALDFDAILTAMYAMFTSGEGAQYLRVPPDPGILTSPAAALGASESAAPGPGEAAALGASESVPSGTESTAALHTFTLDSGASRCFFRDRTVLEPLARPVAVSLADPSGGPVVATSSTVLPCPAVPSGTLSGLYLPSFSTNLVAGSALQDGGVHQFTPAYERVTHCTCARTGRHLATFTRQPGGAPGAADPGGGAAAGAEDPGVGAAAGAADPSGGAAAGAEDPGVGATAGAEDPDGGAAAGAEDPSGGAAAGAEDPGVGATAGAEHPDGGAAAGAEDPSGGAAAGAEDPDVGAAAGAEDPVAGVPAGSGDATRPRPYFVPLLQQVLGQAPPPCPPSSVECPPPVQSQSQFPPASPLPAPSPYTGPTGGLTERREPESRPASPVRTARTGRRVPRERPPPVPGTHYMTLRPSTAPQRVPLPSPPASSLPTLPDPESDSRRAASPTVTRLLATVVTDPTFESSAASALVAELIDFAARCRLDYATSLVAESESESVCPPSVGGECALGTDVLEDRQEEFQCFAAALPHLVSMLVAPEGDPDAPDIPTPRTYAEAMAGPYSSQVKRPPGSPPVFKARYVARGFSQREGVDFFQTFSPTPKMTTLRVLLHIAAQRDYELHSLDFSTAFLQGSLHEEIWLRRPPGFTGSVPPGTQWRLQRPVYGLRQAPREWHDTLRTTLAALGFAPSTADPSLFLRTDTSLLPFYILVYVDDLVFATADTAALAHVKSELQRRHTCTDLGELTSYLGLRITRDRARRTITLTQSHMVQQILQRFRFTYSSPQSTPLPTGHSLSALPSDESVEPSGPKEHMDAAKRVLRYLCSTSGMGLVLGGRDRVVLTGHSDASWADDQATQRSSQGYTFSLGSGSVSWRSTRSSSVLSSSCEAEIYATAMAAQELRWLTYLLTDLGERPRSPPVLYVDNQAAIALCEEHRLEHRTKHIALRYFLARELQQRGQLRLCYVATEANLADVFTKALQPCDHQRFCTLLGLVPAGPHLLTS